MVEGQRESGAAWLTQTKLHPPHLREDTLPREPLLAALHQAIASHPLTLISAPAGYGKTTLLAALAHAYPELSVAWLSLDQEDNEPARFMAALVAALRRANPACGATTQTLLTSLPDPGAEGRRFVGVLVNDILETLPGPVALILEDLHLIAEPTVYASLDYLLERLPPQLHLVVSARHDPPLALARLRARGQLAELRLGDLRFTANEAAVFLNDRFRLGLSLEDLASLYARTEGWAAGMRLIADSLDRIPTPAGRTAFVANFAQTDRYVFDFLADEVLAHQSAAVRAFLLDTSILPELAPALCKAVTGRDDAPAILEEIYRRNLFLVAADEAGTAYRYHHLFAEFLRGRLAQVMPERVAELHRRAAEAENVPARAIAHYLAAQLWEEAADIMEQVGEDIARDGLLGMLRGWIEALPASVRERRPWLLYFLGVSALVRGALDEASSLLERALDGFASAGDEAGQGLCLLEMVSVANSQFDYERQAAFTRQALAYPLPPHGQVQLLMARAFQSEYQGRWSEVDADVDQAMRITLESGDSRAFIIMATILRLDFTLLPNGPERLERYCRQVLARFGDGGGPVQAGAYSLLGFIHFLRGRLDAAIQEAERAYAITRQLGGSVYLEGEVGFVLSFGATIRGDYAAAASYWETRLPQLEQTPAVVPLIVPILYLIGRAYWLQGLLERAGQCHDRICAVAGGQELPEATTTRALMRALLEISEGRYVDAERTLRPAVAVEERVPHCIIFGSARLLLAYLYLRWNRSRDALSELAPLLAECERNRTPGWILKEGAVVVVPLLRLAIERGVHATFAASLLHLLGEGDEPGPVRVPDTGETLTAREIQVLRLIVAGSSNREIARQLVISEHTVKVHITNILGKLRASSRTQAAARARDLRLV
ncbi:MAG: AAA family ATPase [Chloroflexi bacterium]|nr:AAA family ATPase [Chloroflexota bacterium]